jgi:hypothetical protein
MTIIDTIELQFLIALLMTNYLQISYIGPLESSNPAESQNVNV